jgi:hypothetical protein
MSPASFIFAEGFSQKFYERGCQEKNFPRPGGQTFSDSQPRILGLHEHVKVTLFVNTIQATRSVALRC